MPHLGPLSWFICGIFAIFLIVMFLNIFNHISKQFVFVKPTSKMKQKLLKLKW